PALPSPPAYQWEKTERNQSAERTADAAASAASFWQRRRIHADAVAEPDDLQAVVLAGEPDVELVSVPVESGICRGPVCGVIEPRTEQRQVDVGGGPVVHPPRRRLVIRDLLRIRRVTDVEHAQTRLEVTARREPCIRWIVDRAVVRVVSEPGESLEVLERRLTVC